MVIENKYFQLIKMKEHYVIGILGLLLVVSGFYIALSDNNYSDDIKYKKELESQIKMLNENNAKLLISIDSLENISTIHYNNGKKTKNNIPKIHEKLIKNIYIINTSSDSTDIVESSRILNRYYSSYRLINK